jgi:hypothetical protein
MASSFVTMMPPSAQTLRFFKGCSEKPPAIPQVPDFLPSMSGENALAGVLTTGSLCFSAIGIRRRMSVM